MIRFRQPKLMRMASGAQSILLTEAGTWESFEQFAEQFACEMGARITARLDGPDVRVWTIELGCERFRFVYDDFPNGISIEPFGSTTPEPLLALFARIQSESSADGI